MNIRKGHRVMVVGKDADDHHQGLTGVAGRQRIPGRGQGTLLLGGAGVAAGDRDPGRVELVGQRHRGAVGTRLRQRERTFPVVVDPGHRVVHPNGLGHDLLR